MTEDRKYFGMSVKQLGILAGLAVVACLLLAVTGRLVLRGGQFTRSPEATLTPQPTATRVILPTFTPTETQTPVPYEQLIPYGWTRHQTQLIEIWLPPVFETAGTREVSGVAGDAVYLNLALVSSSNLSGYPASVSVSHEPLTEKNLDKFLKAKLSNIPPDVNMVENEKVSINAVKAVRLMFESKTENNLDVNDLLFVFLDGDTVWYVKYSAEIKEFYELLPYFEESIKTFRMAQ